MTTEPIQMRVDISEAQLTQLIKNWLAVMFNSHPQEFEIHDFWAVPEDEDEDATAVTEMCVEITIKPRNEGNEGAIAA